MQRVENELLLDSKGNPYEFAYTRCKHVKKWCDEIIDVVNAGNRFFGMEWIIGVLIEIVRIYIERIVIGKQLI